MGTFERQSHWQNVYQTKGERDVSWFQEIPTISLDLIRATGVKADAPIIDIGGGASRLVDVLLGEGLRAVTVLDVSEKALATSRDRLGPSARQVVWIVADVAARRPDKSYDLWHDRAVTEPGDRTAYAECVRKAVRSGRHVIIATFAPDWPERCSGLPVIRHDAASIGEALGPSFKLIESRRHDHKTPGGTLQLFPKSNAITRGATSAWVESCRGDCNWWRPLCLRKRAGG